VPGGTWQCPKCDTVNGVADGTCMVCDEGKPRAPKPRAPKTRAPKTSTPKTSTRRTGTAASKPDGASGAARRPASRPTGDWKCLKCDTRNAATSLSCLVCDTGWKAATKPRAPKPPTTPTASKTAKTAKATPKPPGSAKRTGTSTPYRPTRPGTTRGAPSGGRSSAPRPSPPRSEPSDLFYAPPGDGFVGYTPGRRDTTPTAPPPPPPPYRGVAGSRPRGGGAPSSEGKSCLKGCLTLFVLGFVLQALVKGCDLPDTWNGSSGDPKPSSSAGAAGPCPERVASELPSGDGAELVEAFRTRNADSGDTKNILLCRTDGGDLYYFGEFADQREKGIAMPAKRTDDGYLAENEPYSYHIHDGVVTITRNGTRIGEERLVKEASPG